MKKSILLFSFINLNITKQEESKKFHQKHTYGKKFFLENIKFIGDVVINQEKGVDGYYSEFVIERKSPAFSIQITLLYDGSIMGKCFRIVNDSIKLEEFYKFNIINEKQLSDEITVFNLFLSIF